MSKKVGLKTFTKIKNEKVKMKNHADIQIRTEAEILSDLKDLCQTKGYLNVIASLHFESNLAFYPENDTIDNADLSHLYSFDRIVRNEINLLIGFCIQSNIDISPPTTENFQKLNTKTKELLNELHDRLNNWEFFVQKLKESLFNQKKEEPETFTDFMKQGTCVKEMMFYASEAAYYFQYLEYIKIRYQNDIDWFIKNKGFSPAIIEKIITYLLELSIQKINILKEEYQKTGIFNLLKMYIISVDEVVTKTGVVKHEVQKFFDAFSTQDNTNHKFQKIGDYNLAESNPLIKISENEYCLIDMDTLFESCYNSPFYWMMNDRDYKQQAEKNRGIFTEEYSISRLKSVFGNNNVYENLYVKKSKSKTDEIDGLIIFGDKLFIIEAKSKGLRLESRSGDLQKIDDDFKKYAQKAYDQGYSKAEQILNGYSVEDANGNAIKIPSNISEVFIICLTSAYYPSLAVQVRHFLQERNHQKIKKPYIIDIFVLDVICEFLENNPIYFLDFIKRRQENSNKLVSENELEIFCYYLTHNLFIKEDNNMIMFDNSCSTDIDKAMYVRRSGHKGSPVPRGILTEFKDTFFSQYIIPYINKHQTPQALKLGFYLLSSSQDSLKQIIHCFQEMLKLCREDGEPHNFTFLGLTVNIVPSINLDTYQNLLTHCEAKRYQAKKDKWLGVLVALDNPEYIEHVMCINSPWVHSEEMHNIVKKGYSDPRTIKSAKNLMQSNFQNIKKIKIGRNDKCPCGSELKYKKCCLL